MAKEELEDIRKEIEKEVDHLRVLYNKLHRMEGLKQRPEKRRIKNTEEKLKKKYPGIKVDRRLLRLVGTMQYTKPSKDKELVREAVYGLYGR